MPREELTQPGYEGRSQHAKANEECEYYWCCHSGEYLCHHLPRTPKGIRWLLRLTYSELSRASLASTRPACRAPWSSVGRRGSKRGRIVASRTSPLSFLRG